MLRDLMTRLAGQRWGFRQYLDWSASPAPDQVWGVM